MEHKLTSRPPRAAFSLLELLVVVAIVIGLAAMVVPSISSLLSSHRITDTGARISALIERGRMHATVRHCVVGVRFFESSQNSGEFVAASLVEIITDPDSSNSLHTNTLSRPFRFPEPIILSQAHSSLLTPDPSAENGSDTVNGLGMLFYRDFLIFPDGSTSLAPSSINPYLGVLDRRDIANDDARNPLFLSIDPRTCRISTFRK